MATTGTAIDTVNAPTPGAPSECTIVRVGVVVVVERVLVVVVVVGGGVVVVVVVEVVVGGGVGIGRRVLVKVGRDGGLGMVSILLLLLIDILSSVCALVNPAMREWKPETDMLI